MIGRAVVLVAVSTSIASAEPPSESAPIAPMEVQVRPPKSETTATALTLAGIALPFAATYMMYEPHTDNPVWAPYGLILGLTLPAAGHWYSGRIGGYGMLIRLGAFTTAMVGYSFVDDAKRCARGEQVPDGCQAGDREIGYAAIGIGIAAWASSWVYDVMSARREVRRHNERAKVQLVPMVVRGASGVAVGGSF